MTSDEAQVPLTIPALVAASTTRHADLEALVDETSRLTYAELLPAVRRAAGAAIAVGVDPGDRVAIWAPNVSEWVIAALGVLSAGGVLVPLNTRFKGPEAAYVIAKSGARVVFTVSEFLGVDYVDMLHQSIDPSTLDAVVVMRGEGAAGRGGRPDGAAGPGGTVSWSDYLRGADKVDPAEIDDRMGAVGPDDLSDIIFTSGTTGRPKGAMVTHSQTLRVFRSWAEIVGLTRGDRYLIVNPFFHTFGYKAGFLASIIVGATVVPHAVFDVPTVLQRVAEERISMLPGPPTLYQSILDHPDRGRHDLSSLRLAVTGAAAVPVEMVRRMRDELTFRTIITGYGLTESTGTVSMCRYDDDPETIANTSGRAIPDTEVRVVDEAGHEVPRGEPGEVVVRGYNVMKGYLDEPDETAATIDADGWLHTGDIGVMDERGYLRITDRKKDMFIVGGFNAYPAEIENILLGNAKVAQAAVVGVPDERMGEVGVAFVIPRPGEELRPAEVIEWSRGAMANYKVPRRVEIVDALPLNASGKVLKFELRERASRLVRP